MPHVIGNQIPAHLPPRHQLVVELQRGSDSSILNKYLHTVERQQQGPANGLRILLSACCETGNTVFVQTLINKGANLNASTKKWLPALLEALRHRHLDVVELLLDHNAQADITDGGQRTALMYAVIHDCNAAMPLLLDKGVKIDARDKNSKTALIHAAASGKTEALIWLLDNHPNLSDNEKVTAFMHAASGGYVDALRILLAQQVNVNATDEQGMTALILGAVGGHQEVLRLLISQGANVNASDNQKKSALTHAASNDHVAAVRELLTNGANCQHLDSDGHSSLWHAINSDCGDASSEHTRDIVEALLSNSGSIANAESAKCLKLAVLRGQNRILDMLIHHGANVNARDSRGRTALMHLASDTNKQPLWNRETLSRLLPAYQDLRTDWEYDTDHRLEETLPGHNPLMKRSTYPEPRTPLHWAAANGHFVAAEAIIEHVSMKLSSDRARQYIDLVQQRGKTALHLAARHNHHQIVSLLLTHGAKIDAVSEGGWTPLLSAAKAGHLATVDLLLKNKPKADVNAVASGGVTSLHWAAQYGHKAIVERILAEAHADKNPKDTFDTTPLLRAGQNGHQEIVQFLRPHVIRRPDCDHAARACDKFTAHVVDFHVKDKATRAEHSPHSVGHVLYELDPEDSQRFATTTNLSTKSAKSDKRRPRFRWIHLPANNLAWAELLIAKMFVEAGPIDAEGFGIALREIGQGQHRGRDPHSRFMRSHCRQQNPGFQNDHPSNSDMTMQPSAKEDDRPRNKTFTTLCMPYLHYETDGNRVEIRRLVKQAEDEKNKPSRSKDPAKTKGREECLIKGYLHQRTGLHLRRTLDQFKHHGVDTNHLDQDQVVYRYTKSQQESQRRKVDPKIFMVDQMWIWVFNDIVVTCFPERFGQTKKDPLHLFDGIINDVGSKTYPQVRSPQELVAAITRRCVGSFDRHLWGHHSTDLAFCEVFELVIGELFRKSTKLLKRFEADSSNTTKWLRDPTFRGSSSDAKKIDTNNTDTPEGREDLDTELDEKPLNAENPRANPDFVDRLLDIREETRLLIECKDIEEEISILNSVYDQQTTVLNQAADAFTDSLNQGSSWRRLAWFQRQLIEQHKLDLERMEKQAHIVNKGLTQVLDLKQKHANAIEARSARARTEETARQGQTIMVFTVVTIIFLPLSFMAALLAVEVREYPFDSSGEGRLPLSWVSKLVFGVGLTISAVMVAVAFLLGDIPGSTARIKTWWLGMFNRTKASRPSKLLKVSGHKHLLNADNDKVSTADSGISLHTNSSLRRRTSAATRRNYTDESRETAGTASTAADGLV